MIGKQVARGAIWLVAARLATKCLDLLAMLIIARILTPADFGQVALAVTVLTIAEAVLNFSVSNYLLQVSEPEDELYDTAFTLSFLRGLLLATLMLALAWPMQLIYEDEKLVALMGALAIAPFLQGLISPRFADFQRALKFSQSFKAETYARAAAFVASVAMALLTRSYWALIVGRIAATAIGTLYSYYLAPYRPRLSFKGANKIFAFTGWLTLSHAVNAFNWQADRFFIGNSLPRSVLGNYTVGSELASLPTQIPMAPLMQALYAGFARLSTDMERMRHAYQSGQSALMFFALPLGFIVSVLAEPLIDLAVGRQWEIAAGVVAVLAPVFAVQMLTSPAQSAAMALGHTRSILQRDVIMLFVRLPLILLGLSLAGLNGVVWARVGSGLFAILLNMQMIRHQLSLSYAAQFGKIWRPLAAGAIILLAGHGAVSVFPAPEAILPMILYMALFGGILLLVYVTACFTLWGLSGRPNGIETRIVEKVSQLTRRDRSVSKS